MNLIKQLEATVRERDAEIERLNKLLEQEVEHSKLIEDAANELRSEIERLNWRLGR